MYLYSLTLQRSGAITHAIYGNFSAPKAQEIVVARGKILELLRPDESGKVHTVLSVEIFGIVRALSPFRLTGSNKDYIIVGSDSGRIVILEYNSAKNRFERTHCETYGKSGCRRLTPGQLLATDPRGRAVMIGAIEKQKLVYVLNRDAAAKLTISSPLEAHKAHALTHALVGVDVAFENPLFAALEVDYADVDTDPSGEALKRAHKQLVFYELDLGLNHVVRKQAEPVDASAHLLITVPGGTDGPSGVLVCSEGFVSYRIMGQPELRAPLPRRTPAHAKREGRADEQGLLVVASATLKQKDFMFFLLQTELGDLYKVSLTHRDERVEQLHVSYFDTVPVATALCVMRTGFLFVASEFGNHAFYQVARLGSNDEGVVIAQRDQPLPPLAYFEPRSLRNLLLLDDVDSMAPISDLRVADLQAEDAPQLYALSGRGARSSFRVLRHGLAVTQVATSEGLPGTPSGVWTLKQASADEHDKYIVLSFIDATMVVSIGEQVDLVNDVEKLLGIVPTVPSLLLALLHDDSLLQVHPHAVRHIRGAANARLISEWKPPGKRLITHATANARQLLLATQGGDVFYFELDASGQLLEVEKRETRKEVCALDLLPVPAGRQRGRFAAVGELATRPDGLVDASVRVLSLDPTDHLKSLGLLALPAAAESVLLTEMVDSGGSYVALYAGLTSGVLQRAVVDSATGEISDPRTRYAGSRRVRLLKLRMGGSSAVLALSSRAWLAYHLQQRFHLDPLSHAPLEHAASFSSEQCPEGVVGIAGSTMYILSVDRLGDTFNQKTFPLRYTPRGLVLHPASKNFAIVESDHRTRSVAREAAGRSSEAPATPPAASGLGEEVRVKTEPIDMDNEGAPAPASTDGPAPPAMTEATAAIEQQRRELNTGRAGPGQWASCVRVMAPSGTTLQLLELDIDEAATAVALCQFHDSPALYIAVGVAKNLQWNPRSCTSAAIALFRFDEAGAQLELVHRTPVDDVVGALAPFQGRLLAGVGKALRIYDMGKRKMLRKCENKGLPFFIKTLQAQGDRIVAGDMADSFQFCKYKRADNVLVVFADDYSSRWLTSAEMLDYDTVAGADKFGNVSVMRVPADVSEDVEEDVTGNKLRHDIGYLNAAPHKLQNVAQFHVGETVTKLTRASFTLGSEALLYGTVFGGVGVLLPFASREDVDFFSHLEMFMRQENPPLCGRDHLSFRSYFTPVKDTIDGDLCEQFAQLDAAKQRQIAHELDERTPAEVMKKLEDIRNKIL